jgi:hypothetical protein
VFVTREILLVYLSVALRFGNIYIRKYISALVIYVIVDRVSLNVKIGAHRNIRMIYQLGVPVLSASFWISSKKGNSVIIISARCRRIAITSPSMTALKTLGNPQFELKVRVYIP